MTSAAADRPRGGRIGAFLAWLSHFDVWLITGATVTAVVMGLALAPDTPAEWWTWTPFVFMVGAMASIGGQLFHDARWPCERCMERFPLDASAEAEQKRAVLHTLHWSGKRMILTLLTLYAVMVGAPWALGPQLGTLGLIPWFGFWAFNAYARRQHNKLQPWCPWCRHGGRGPRSTVTPPTPRETVDA